MVVGGGVAGAAAAIRMAHHGFDVHLAERAVFPREKVCGCCLGAAGLTALDAIGLGEPVRQLGVRVDRFEGFFDPHGSASAAAPEIAGERSRSGFAISIRPGVAVSRAALDTTLLQAARRAGVHVDQPAEACIVRDRLADGGGVWVRRRTAGDRSWRDGERFDLVVIATGLSGRFETSDHDSKIGHPVLPWRQPPAGPMGVAVHLPADSVWAKRWRIDPGAIQMICSDVGYVGIVRLPGGGLDVAAALDLRRRPKSPGRAGAAAKRQGRPKTLLGGPPWIEPLLRLVQGAGVLPAGEGADDASFDDWCRRQAVWMATPPLRRARCPGRDRVVAIGDAMRYVEPLTGEGMTWGIESGLAVADCWAEWWSGATGRRGAARSHDFGSVWTARAESLQSSRRKTCDRVTRALRNRSVRLLVQWSLRRAPWLSYPLATGLARGAAFPVTDRRGTAEASVSN